MLLQKCRQEKEPLFTWALPVTTQILWTGDWELSERTATVVIGHKTQPVKQTK